MMQSTAVEEVFAGEKRRFDLPLGAQRAIEEKCGVGLGKVMARLYTVATAESPTAFDFRIDDYRETILQGLIGGGMSNMEASRLVVSTIDTDAPKSEFVILATRIIAGWWYGVPKPKPPGTNGETTTAPVGSTSETYTGQEPS